MVALIEGLGRRLRDLVQCNGPAFGSGIDWALNFRGAGPQTCNPTPTACRSDEACPLRPAEAARCACPF